MGESADAKAHFDAAISAFEASGDRRGRGMATLGLLTVWHPGAAVEIPLLEGAVSDAAGAGDKDLEGRALHSWGDRLFMAGNNEAALEKLDRAASLFDQTADKVAQGTVHNSLGRLYRRHGRLDLALNEQLKALALHQASSSPFNHLQSLNAVAVTYQSMGEPLLARKYLDQALAMAERSGSPRVQDTIRANLAGTLDDQGDYRGRSPHARTGARARSRCIPIDAVWHPVWRLSGAGAP